MILKKPKNEVEVGRGDDLADLPVRFRGTCSRQSPNNPANSAVLQSCCSLEP